MAQYKVPQDVEAEDKLIGPFSFRQFVYLLVAGGLVALAIGLFQIFPALVIIPIPFILLFLALALPIKKDQPMETYLAAVISYYLKPHNRVWTPGQRESTIKIAAPKTTDEDSRSRGISGDEVTHRLSFLADIVDSGGRAIDGTNSGQISEDLVMEANTTNDIFETGHFERLESTIAKDENERHQNVMEEMRQAIFSSEGVSSEKNSGVNASQRPMNSQSMSTNHPIGVINDIKETLRLSQAPKKKPVENLSSFRANSAKKDNQTQPKPSIIELANNTDFSVATIAKEANRMKEKEGEVYISLH